MPADISLSATRLATEKWCMVVATAKEGERDPMARCTRTASSAVAPRPECSAGTSRAGPPWSRNAAIAFPSGPPGPRGAAGQELVESWQEGVESGSFAVEEAHVPAFRALVGALCCPRIRATGATADTSSRDRSQGSRATARSSGRPDLTPNRPRGNTNWPGWAINPQTWPPMRECGGSWV